MEVLKRALTAASLTCLIGAAAPVFAGPNAGAYLAARQADQTKDFAASVQYYSKALFADPTNEVLMENAMRAMIALGQIEQAGTIADAMNADGYDNLIGALTATMVDIKAGNWTGVLNGLDAGRSISPLVDGLTRAWSLMGDGDLPVAFAAFEEVIATEGMANYGLIHKAYALASVGDFEAAEAVFRDNPGLRFSRQSVIGYAQILSQLEKNDEAGALMDRVFGGQLDPGLTVLRNQLSDGKSVAYSAVRTPAQGMADLYLLVASILQGDAPDDFTLLYARGAMYFAPEETQAILTTARLLESLGQYDLANETFSKVAPDDPAFLAAELGRAEVLSAAEKPDAAIEVLDALTRTHPDRAEVWAAKGDNLRRVDRFDAAKVAYTRALELYKDDSPGKWFVYFTRGIANHQLDEWSAAEADFRAALSLQPDQPQVLNYLGYSLVERGEQMAEALAMIETAADARPDSGAIVDSLGWVYFQLGRYDEAVLQLERAASLEPLDPIINDHLGDALWAVGREIEAAFQWQRALSFDPEEEEAARIRDKLALGLDAVLLAEGAAALRVASED